MTGHKIGILLSAISFTIGALVTLLPVNDNQPTRGFNWRAINWISLGLAFYVWSNYIGAPR